MNTNKLKTLTLAIATALALSAVQMPTLAAAKASIPVSAAQTASKTLTAEGKGAALFQGNGTITISGTGTLRIRDVAGDAQISVSGNGRRKATTENGWTRYAGFRGSATITGTNVVVELTGGSIKLKATGNGTYVLRGKGTASVTVDGSTTTSSWSGVQKRTL
jgi:hypothetical protein